MKAEIEHREQTILDAAVELILRQGYEKTTMSDIADEAGVSRGIVYLHFKSKDELVEALLQREVTQYVETWLEHIEADPRGGTVGSIYRAVLYAINSRPIMAAMMRRDRRVLGSYLRKPNNLFASFQSSAMSVAFLQALQDAGTVRQDVDTVVMSHIMDILAYGMLTISEFRDAGELPSYDLIMESIARMLDQQLTPADGGNSDAGKRVIRELAAATKAHFGQARDSKQS